MTIDDRRNDEPSFNIYVFKNWLAKQPDFKMDGNPFNTNNNSTSNDLLESRVMPRLGLERLKKQISSHNKSLPIQEATSIAKSFKSNGGIVAEVNDLNVQVKIDNKLFTIPKAYVKKS